MEFSDVLRENWMIDDEHIPAETKVFDKAESKRVYMTPAYTPSPSTSPTSPVEQKKKKEVPTTSGNPQRNPTSEYYSQQPQNFDLCQMIMTPSFNPQIHGLSLRKTENPRRKTPEPIPHRIHLHPYSEYIKMAAHLSNTRQVFFPTQNVSESGDTEASSSSAPVQQKDSSFPRNFLDGQSENDVDSGNEEAYFPSLQTALTRTITIEDADNTGVLPEASAEAVAAAAAVDSTTDERRGGGDNERDEEDGEKREKTCIDDNRVTNGVGGAFGEKLAKNSPLEQLLQQPVRQSAELLARKSVGNSSDIKPDKMQFYQQPPAQHLAPPRTTPPSDQTSFAQPYAMMMRPHEEETRQIMNLDNQQAHNSSPTSSWNAHQHYTQMSNMNAYPPRGPPIYPPPQMQHVAAPTTNPYYAPPPSHMQPQAMIPPGIQQPYYSTQSPLTGTPPMPYGGQPGCAAPPTNGNAPIFSFSKPRPDTVNGAGGNSGPTSSGPSVVQRRKKQPDLSSPRYQNEEVDASVFPDMSDFPLLDVIQSKAKKDAGRKPCRPHLCEQSRMLISRVCHFNREFSKRLASRHPLTNSPMSKPDQWTSQIMGISLATVRKCMDMAQDEEVFTRCTDKNLVNLTPAERTEREEMLAKLSTVFEDEKSLGAGTAGLTIAEYSPRRSYSSSLVRQTSSIDEKSNQSSIYYNVNGNDTGSGSVSGTGGETTFMNLDENSKDVPTPLGSVSTANDDEIGTLMGGLIREDVDEVKETPNESSLEPVVQQPNQEQQQQEQPQRTGSDTPKIRGRPKKSGGTQRKQKEGSTDGSEVSDEKEEIEKKTEDENETTTDECNDGKTTENVVVNNVTNVVEAEREDDAASSEGTTRSETATPEPTGKGRRAAKKKRGGTNADPDVPAPKKSKVNGNSVDDENVEHKMVTRRTRAAQNS